MGEIFRNKFFIIFLIAACILTFATIGLHAAGYGNLISDAVSTVIQPFQTFANMLSSSVSGFVDYFTIFNELREENAVMRERIQELESESVTAQVILERYTALREFYGLKQDRPDFRFQDAEVIAGGASNYISRFTINKGAFHGLERNMPVVAAPGSVVGFISEVGVRTATVTPFMSTSSSVGAVVRRTGETGIVEGDFALEQIGLSRMVHLYRNADVEVGDRVYSSGYGGLYPPGLFVGIIREVYSDPLTQTLAALIEPGVNFNQIRDVMVILEFEWIFG